MAEAKLSELAALALAESMIDQAREFESSHEGKIRWICDRAELASAFAGTLLTLARGSRPGDEFDEVSP